MQLNETQENDPCMQLTVVTIFVRITSIIVQKSSACTRSSLPVELILARIVSVTHQRFIEIDKHRWLITNGVCLSISSACLVALVNENVVHVINPSGVLARLLSSGAAPLGLSGAPLGY